MMTMTPPPPETPGRMRVHQPPLHHALCRPRRHRRRRLLEQDGGGEARAVLQGKEIGNCWQRISMTFSFVCIDI